MLLKGLQNSNILPRHASHQPGTPILELSGVNVHYNDRTALKDISFQLESGASLAVVGPNGAGKSTLFKVISGVLEPDSGDIRIYGGGPGRHICIAYVPQRAQVDWDFPVSVADVAMMGRVGKIGLLRWPRARDWEAVRLALQLVGLDELADRQIGELSGGQQQRMFIARALAQEAELILMDEPFTGLDLISQESIFQILEELGKRNVTVLVALHDLKLAAEHFDWAMLLNRRLLGFGKPDEIFIPETLLQAYGDHLRIVPAGDELLALSDTCCDEGEEPVLKGMPR